MKLVFLHTDTSFKGRGGGGRTSDQGPEAGSGAGQVQRAAYHKVPMSFQKNMLIDISNRACQLEEKEKALLGAELEATFSFLIKTR